MTAFEAAAGEFAELVRRVEQLESQLRSLRSEKPGPSRTHYKPSEVAEMLGRNTRTVHGWIKDGRLDAVDMGGWWAVPAEAVDALTSRRAS